MALGIALADRCDAPASWAALPAAAGLLLVLTRRFRAHAAVSVALAVGFHAQAARLAEARAASAGEPREGVVEGVVVRRSAALAPMLNESWSGTAGPCHDSSSGLRYRFLS